MKKNILFILLFSLISAGSFAQNDAKGTTGGKEKDYPVSSVFESGYLIDAHTTVIPEVNTLEFVIQHKFGTIANGRTDLWGVYAAGANIRLGLNYVLAKNFQVGAGITKKAMTTDVDAKWTLFQQTKKNSVPVSVALYGNFAIDGRNLSSFESGYVMPQAYKLPLHYRFDDRLSYFSELIVSRKFTTWLSLQGGVSFSHYNAVGKAYDHDKVGVHCIGRIKVSPQGSIIFNYDKPLEIKKISEQWAWTNPPKPNIAFGYEISTGNHAFQIYMASTSSILPQDNIMWNQNDYKNNGFALGFTMTRLWGF